MRATSSPRKLAGWAGNESGVAMMFIIMATLLISTITVTVMQIVAADLTGGIRELQADQVYNIAHSGAHYAIGKMQLSGAGAYAGETTTITSGSTTLGTATITVSCIDTGLAPPCSGNYGGYRRIISVGSLPALAPTRTVVAVVQATQGSGGYASCGLTAFQIVEATKIYGDIGSNGSISVIESSHVYADAGSPQQYKGLGRYVTTISCGTSPCSSVFDGGTFLVPGPVCPTIPFPSMACAGLPCTASLNPGSNYTMNTQYTWGDVIVNNVDLIIVAPTAGVTQVVSMNTLQLSEKTNARVIISGPGNVELRIRKATGMSLLVGESTKFGALPSDTSSVPAPVPASKLIVYINSSATGSEISSALFYDEAIYIAGTIIAPNGEIYLKEVSGKIYGAMQASIVHFEEATTQYSDTSGLAAIGGSTWTSFTSLRSWKDQ